MQIARWIKVRRKDQGFKKKPCVLVSGDAKDRRQPVKVGEGGENEVYMRKSPPLCVLLQVAVENEMVIGC